MPVTVNDAATLRAIRELKAYTGQPRAVMQAVGAGLTRYVQDTIRGGGRKRPYAPLSTWTKRRTGRTQPLVTLARNFSFHATNDRATIFFVPPTGKKFSIWAHHRGYTTPARMGRPIMRIPFSTGGAAFLRSVGASHVPAREVWPTAAEAGQFIRQGAIAWLRRGVDRWR